MAPSKTSSTGLAPDMVSIDQVGNDHASIIDATATIVEGDKAVVYACGMTTSTATARIRLMAQIIGLSRPVYP